MVLNLMFRSLKSDFLHYYGVSDSLMHFTIGAAFYAVAFAATRRPWLSLAPLVALQLGNEFWDIYEQSFLPMIDYRQSIADTLWTVAAPTMAAAVLATSEAVLSLLPRSPR
jgi:hypothetical protein